MIDSDNMLSVLESYMHPDATDIARRLANDFRNRRVEQGLTREAVAAKSGVAFSNISRFEQKGLISLKNLILLAIATDYLHEISAIFSTPKYSTMEELTQIRRNTGKKRAYPHKPRSNEKD
ncbi:MAG: helix-turn-helix transcriptional regulator [Bacteroidales bacterium]|nr:helix-turn-helix transcriptional regulator [Bacteroidales bacterium]